MASQYPIVKRITEDEETLLLVLRALKVSPRRIVEDSMRDRPLLELVVGVIRERKEKTTDE